jgi:hypothetical protein
MSTTVASNPPTATERGRANLSADTACGHATTERAPSQITCRLWKHDKHDEKCWWGCTFNSKIFFVLASATATTSECGLWVQRVDDSEKAYWVNDAHGLFFFEEDEPSEYVIEDASEQEKEEGEDEQERDPHTAHDNEWLCPQSTEPAEAGMGPGPGAIEPTGEHSLMHRALQMGLQSLRVRLVTDAPNIEEHIEETFQVLLQLARGS